MTRLHPFRVRSWVRPVLVTGLLVDAGRCRPCRPARPGFLEMPKDCLRRGLTGFSWCRWPLLRPSCRTVCGSAEGRSGESKLEFFGLCVEASLFRVRNQIFLLSTPSTLVRPECGFPKQGRRRPDVTAAGPPSDEDPKNITRPRRLQHQRIRRWAPICGWNAVQLYSRMKGKPQVC